MAVVKAGELVGIAMMQASYSRENVAKVWPWQLFRPIGRQMTCGIVALSVPDPAELAERLEPTHVFDPQGVGLRAIKVELPETLRAYEEKAVFCENKANELLSAAATARLRETKIALLDVSEQWMTLALYYRTKLREAEKDQG
ncbi:MAG TPA: hypothetical protein VLV55_08460 [Rhizomicrobium sp.]|nr:hypothetical protein [Rhizomicrobium sp.]